MRTDDGLLNLQASAVAADLNGGAISFYGGGALLVRVEIAGMALRGAGVVEASNMDAMPVATGKPDAFVVTGQGGEVRMSGSVGPAGADWIYEPEMIVRGLRFRVPSFTYSVNAAAQAA
jgi:hypothetical protein